MTPEQQRAEECSVPVTIIDSGPLIPWVVWTRGPGALETEYEDLSWGGPGDWLSGRHQKDGDQFRDGATSFPHVDYWLGLGPLPSSSPGVPREILLRISLDFYQIR